MIPDRPMPFRLAAQPLVHRRFSGAMCRIEEVHCCRRQYARGEGALIVAPSGGGKSTIAKAYRTQFPREHTVDGTRVPVLAVSAPECPTAGHLAEAILIALGDPAAHRWDTPKKTERIHDLLQRCGVELILLDEFHHLYYAPTLPEFRRITDWLKLFIDRAEVGVIGLGLAESEHVVDANRQLRRRFSSRFLISPFSLADEEDFKELRGILKAFEAELPLPTEIPLFEANMARRFHVGSYGILDYVVKILEGAASVAIRAGLPSIDMAALAAGFRERVWETVPERLNPFFPDSPLRPLDRFGEIFADYAHGDILGSPLGKRLSVTTSLKRGLHGA